MKIKKGPFLYAVALFVGILSEFVGFQIEQSMIQGGLPARIGFPVSLIIFMVFPFLTTGVLIFKATRDYFAAVILSTMVIPATLAIIKYFGL